MNDQIKELCAQARVYADELLGQGLPDTVWQDRYHEKLVHLVVWECAGIYQRIDNGNLHMGTDNYIEALSRTFWDEE